MMPTLLNARLAGTLIDSSRSRSRYIDRSLFMCASLVEKSGLSSILSPVKGLKLNPNRSG